MFCDLHCVWFGKLKQDTKKYTEVYISQYCLYPYLTQLEVVIDVISAPQRRIAAYLSHIFFTAGSNLIFCAFFVRILKLSLDQ